MDDELVVFEDLPSRKTPLNASNLNHNFDTFKKQIKTEAGKIDNTLQEIETAKETLQNEITTNNQQLTTQITQATEQLETDIETKITDATTNLESQIEKNKQDLETQIGEQIAKITTLSIEIVTELPTQDISKTTIYLIKPGNLPQDMVINSLPKKIVRDELVISPLDVNAIAQISVSEEDFYFACFYVNNDWVVVGSTKTDLSDYAKKSEIPKKVSDLSNDLSFLQSSSSNYIKSLKISGKTITYTTGAGTTGTLTTQDTTYSVATTSSDGLMSSTDKSKLNDIASGANNYSLPTASSTTKGGIMVGDGLTISGGKLSTELTYEVVSTW